MTSTLCKVPVRYEYGEHTADISVIAYGCTLEEAFVNAALGVANLTYYTDRVEPREYVEVRVSGDDLEQLLFNWIDEYIFLFDGRKFAYGDYFKDIALEGSGPYSIRALVGGEHFDINKHGYRGLIVKAMTYNMMEIRKINDYWRLVFVVDI
ncbi:MAG: archease [Vulcanisaeta sp. AZ3]|jgi:SHS2 domain-containing protein|nr:MAG: archease [Vulcanisaeta sp. AZ3]